MTIIPPIVPEWPGLNPPLVCTVHSLERAIPLDRYSHVYWIARLVDNVVIELCPLKDWFFTIDGRLIGEVDFAAWKQTVEIGLDEYVILELM